MQTVYVIVECVHAFVRTCSERLENWFPNSFC